MRKLRVDYRARRTHLIPVQQEAINEDPDDALARLLVILRDPVEDVTPAVDRRVVGRHVLLLVQVVV